MCPHQGNVSDMIYQEKQNKSITQTHTWKESYHSTSKHACGSWFSVLISSFKIYFNCFGYYMPIFGSLVLSAILCIVIPISCAFLVWYVVGYLIKETQQSQKSTKCNKCYYCKCDKIIYKNKKKCYHIIIEEKGLSIGQRALYKRKCKCRKNWQLRPWKNTGNGNSILHWACLFTMTRKEYWHSCYG